MAAIAGMVEEARRHQVQATAAVGTAGLRIARNRDEVIAAIRTRTGVTVEVISGEEESRLAYLAAGGRCWTGPSLIVRRSWPGDFTVGDWGLGHGLLVDWFGAGSWRVGPRLGLAVGGCRGVMVAAPGGVGRSGSVRPGRLAAVGEQPPAAICHDGVGWGRRRC